jgi:16S rRNA (uracil1498-N3)-methyltransferase
VRRAVVDSAVLDEITAGQGALPDDVAHYLGRVLRLESGVVVELFDGTGRAIRGRFVTPGSLEGAEAVTHEDALPPLVIAQARVRGPKLDEVVRRSTELGASAIWVFDAKRSAKCQVRLDRALRIAQDAARQSGRATVPDIEHLGFEELVERFAAFEGVRCVCAVGAEGPISHALAGASEGAAVAIGPEGGLDPAEREALIRAGATAVGLGVHVLRTETAAAAVLAAAQVALGRM